jgi:diacylglycerol kinase family enzyme
MRTHSFLVVNPRSRDASVPAAELASAAREAGVETHVLAQGEDLGEVARASGAGILGVAGGDGSLAEVALAAIETDAAFVCVPFGTRNHFARDLGLDRRDPFGALSAFTAGTERRIDVGRVAGRVFVNNVSFGIYASLVRERERHRRRGEALARARALFRVARARHRLQLRVNGEPVRARAILVGNNRYELDVLTLGARARLDEGVLDLRTAAGWWPSTWHEDVGDRFHIELSSGSLTAAIDGEPVRLESPLELESLPGALRVLVPRR